MLVPLNNYQGQLKLGSGPSLSLWDIRYAMDGRASDMELPKLFGIQKNDSETQPYDTGFTLVDFGFDLLWIQLCPDSFLFQ